MNPPSQVKRTVVSVPPRLWSRFRDAMLKARSASEEVIGFMFCSRHETGDGILRLLPKTWIVPGPECYERQSTAGLELRQDVHRYLLENYLLNGYDMLHIHTHPGTMQPSFSSVDDHFERQYSNFLGSLRTDSRLVSGVFDQDLNKSTFRLWERSGVISDGPVSFLSEGLQSKMMRDHELPGGPVPIFSRQLVFGENVQHLLGEIKVALIGCGGIGAVFAEQLARLGVRKWVLVDADHLEFTNLNRMPFATSSMAKHAWKKVRYVKSLISRVWGKQADIKVIGQRIESQSATKEVAKADLIVVATDNHHSRLVAQRLALSFLRPMMSLGTHIELRQEGRIPLLLCRVTFPPLDGGWCLVCGDVIDPSQAAIEISPSDVSNVLSTAGYIPEVAAPAVYWLNSACASAAVSVVHGALAGFTEISNGLDWVLDYQRCRWIPIKHEESQACYFCSPEGLLATAGQ